MPDDLHQGALAGGGDLRGQFAALVFEGDEFDLDQFVEGQFMADAGKERLAHAAVPYFEDGFEMLRLAFKGAPVGGCQFGLQGNDLASFRRELKNGKGSAFEPWCI